MEYHFKLIFLAEIIYSLHLLGVFYLIFGFLLLKPKHLKYYIYLQLGMLIWLYTIGQCTLTGLEYKLRTGKDNNKSAE